MFDQNNSLDDTIFPSLIDVLVSINNAAADHLIMYKAQFFLYIKNI